MRPTVKALVVAHLVATPLVTWWAIVNSSLGAPWPAVTALWHGQAVLLGIWCGLSAAPLWHKCRASLTGLVWLSAMPIARVLSLYRVPPFGRAWLSFFGLQVLYLAMTVAASITAIVIARKVWPRWTLMTASSNHPPMASQFSIGQLLVATAACTPVLLAAKLLHDHVALYPLRSALDILSDLVIDSPLAATVALLSTWAA
ncbi:MAG TPA: hypothetical protein VFI31_22415, partial [Pirellulales bacterium]|nr:hypothetical protein [Pirellulales bacterium]